MALGVVYTGTPLPTQPLDNRQQYATRNAEIRQRYEDGATLAQLAEEYGLSVQRVSQIVQGKNH